MIALAQGTALTMDSAVSVALLVAIIGGVAFISRSLTQAQEQLKSIRDLLNKLENLPERLLILEKDVGIMQRDVTGLQEDLNNLWAEWRSDDTAQLKDIRRHVDRPVRRSGGTT